eukprot:1743639-Pleurochrysis_carterae.AAC.1
MKEGDLRHETRRGVVDFDARVSKLGRPYTYAQFRSLSESANSRKEHCPPRHHSSFSATAGVLAFPRRLVSSATVSSVSASVSPLQCGDGPRSSKIWPLFTRARDSF